MKPKSILFDAAFDRKFKKYIVGLSDSRRERFKQKMKLFKEDIFAPGLKTHKLKGNLSDYHSSSKVILRDWSLRYSMPGVSTLSRLAPMTFVIKHPSNFISTIILSPTHQAVLS